MTFKNKVWYSLEEPDKQFCVEWILRGKREVTVKCLVQILRVFVPLNPEIRLKPAFFRQYRIADGIIKQTLCFSDGWKKKAENMPKTAYLRGIRHSNTDRDSYVEYHGISGVFNVIWTELGLIWDLGRHPKRPWNFACFLITDNRMKTTCTSAKALYRNGREPRFTFWCSCWSVDENIKDLNELLLLTTVESGYGSL